VLLLYIDHCDMLDVRLWSCLWALRMYSFALSIFEDICMWNGIFLWKMLNVILSSAQMAISCLICAWISWSFYLGLKTHLSLWMFSLHVTLWRSLSFFFHKGTSCTMLNLKSWNWYMRCLCLKNMLLCYMCCKFFILGAKPFTTRKSLTSDATTV
jgi:hypothetical protein